MEQSFATPGPGPVQLSVENQVGLVVVTTDGSGTTSVSLEADTAGAEELVERAKVECRLSGDRHLVTVRVPHLHGMKFTRRNGVTVRVTVPEGSDVDVSTASADIEVHGPVGLANLKSGSGEIATDNADEVNAKTASADIEVGSVRGDLRMHTASGDLRCLAVGGRAKVDSASGSIEIGSTGTQVDIRATWGDVRLGDVAGDVRVVAVSGGVEVLSVARGTVQLRSISGDIEVGIAAGVALDVDAETMSGRVDSEIALSDRPGDVQGAPAVTLAAKTVSGDIAVRRSMGAYAR